MPSTDIKDSTEAYENWLQSHLAGEIVRKDLAKKHKKMKQNAFTFLRATYWRWAETIIDVCPELTAAPQVLAIGDLHLENFGTWRDADGRLVWGVNDFDEAAVMPYALDLVRLATSAIVARKQGGASKTICKNILAGYSAGLRAPAPYVLDRDHGWLRKLLEVSEAERTAFWDKLAAKETQRATPPARYRKQLLAAMPTPYTDIAFSKRTAGAGSLGRPRWLALATHRGGPTIREAKALVPSAWSRVHGPRNAKTLCGKIAAGSYRSPDPWYDVSDDIVVRRLSPNNRKIEIDVQPTALLSPHMLHAMGFECANIHLGVTDAKAAIVRDLRQRKSEWLHRAAADAAKAVTADYEGWKKN